MRHLNNITQLKSFIFKTIKEILKESFPKNFNFNKFIKMSQREKLDYTKKTLQYTNKNFLGAGTSRIVYRLDSKKVLKIAVEDKIGAGQNLEEKRLTDFLPEIFPKIYNFAEDGSWLISELVRPLVDEKEFLELFGFTWPLFSNVIYNFSKENSIEAALNMIPNNSKKHGYSQETDLTEEAIDMIQTHLFRNIIEAINAGLDFGDILVLKHWGKTADGRLVILDAGLTSKSKYLYY